jgi:hypothetical protein
MQQEGIKMETVYVLKTLNGYVTKINPNRTAEFDPSVDSAMKIPTKLIASTVVSKYFTYYHCMITQIYVSKEERDYIKETWRMP